MNALIVLAFTACTSGGVCFNPATNVQWISWDAPDGKLKISVNEDVYKITGLTPYLTQIDTPIYDESGTMLTVSLSFKHWTTTSGRLHVQHWELLGGTLQ